MQALYNYVDLLVEKNEPLGEISSIFFEGIAGLSALTSKKRSNQDSKDGQHPSKQPKPSGGQEPLLDDGAQDQDQGQVFSSEQYELVPFFDFGLKKV